MKTFSLFLIVLFNINYVSFGQQFTTNSTSQSEILKLKFLIGNWEGTGWSMGRDGQKHEFQQTEKVTFKLDSTAILIEGKGTADGKVIHDALAILSFNEQDSSYDFRSQLANGRGGNFKGELKDDAFYWYPGNNMRYIISLNEKGEWYEKGEVERDGEWIQFLEMNLKKKE